MITGTSTSRLSELKKFMVSENFLDNYEQSTSISNNGVNTNTTNLESTPQIIVYYIDGIRYKDVIENGVTTTTFSFEGQGYDSPDFVDLPIYKDPEKNNLISTPKIFSDVFIDRQTISAFRDFFYLEEVNSLFELTTFAGGNYFNIVENT